MLLVKNIGITPKKIILFLFSIISLIFIFSSFSAGIFTESGVGPGFTPFFVSILGFLCFTISLFKDVKYKPLEIKYFSIIISGFVCMWLSLYVNTYLICLITGVFSYMISATKNIRNSIIVGFGSLVIILVFKLLGVDID
jgi:hypothetical protein